MTRFSVALTLVCIAVFACKRIDDNELQPTGSAKRVLVEKSNPASVPTGDPIPETELGEKIKGIMLEKGDFHWDWVDLHTLWSAVQYTDHSVAVGYKPANVTDVSSIIDKIDLQSAEWKSVHDAIINLVVETLSDRTGAAVNLKDILVEDDKDLPILVFRLTDEETLTKLYNLQNVRYLEPLGYWYDKQRSSSGCGGSTEPLNAEDFSTLDPGCKVPWNYNSVYVPAAWNTAQGSGIKIGVIDAGISSSQSLLGSAFTNGYSSGNRTITTDYTYGSSAYTSCKHGTSMTGLAAGPRNTYGATTGVAYKSSLHFIRACDDVVLDGSSEQLGVKNALVKMGKINSIKIISMSIGTPFYSGVIADGVSFAYNKGKLMFAAAGTSFDWTSWWGVIYPAALSQCVAVTGVREDGSTCATCHDGSQVDFTIPMERNANNNRNSLSLDASGYNPTYIGGSSCATATTAGIAALVWSVKPNLSRSQVYTCLRNTAQYYPNLSSSHGYGNVNAAAAVAMATGM